MKLFSTLPLLVLMVATPNVWSQQQGQQQQGAQQRVAELKESIAANKAKLQKYQWIETVQVSVKGENKKTEQQACRYGPDGKVIKSPIGSPPETKSSPRGLRGKIAEKKKGEMQDYIENLKTLISNYAPPNPTRLQAVFQEGKANLNLSSGGPASLSFADYYKPGDKVAFAFDPAQKKLQSYNVNTYMDSPEDVVALSNKFSTLPDGTNYLEQTVLTSSGKQIQITTTGSNYTPIGH
jgi:hypothetical protein